MVSALILAISVASKRPGGVVTPTALPVKRSLTATEPSEAPSVRSEN